MHEDFVKETFLGSDHLNDNIADMVAGYKGIPKEPEAPKYDGDADADLNELSGLHAFYRGEPNEGGLSFADMGGEGVQALIRKLSGHFGPGIEDSLLFRDEEPEDALEGIEVEQDVEDMLNG